MTLLSSQRGKLTQGKKTCFFHSNLDIPAGDGLIDVRRAGVALICFIDRLGAPLLPPFKGFMAVSIFLLLNQNY